MKLRIVQCPDPTMWYAKHVGELVPFRGSWPGEGYKSVDDGGYINVVKFTDAEVVEGVDRHVEAVRSMLLTRSQVGLKKYGVTTERKDIDLIGWLNHLQEELCDAAVYIDRIKEEVNAHIPQKEGADPSAPRS